MLLSCGKDTSLRHQLHPAALPSPALALPALAVVGTSALSHGGGLQQLQHGEHTIWTGPLGRCQPTGTIKWKHAGGLGVSCHGHRAAQHSPGDSSSRSLKSNKVQGMPAWMLGMGCYVIRCAQPLVLRLSLGR